MKTIVQRRSLVLVPESQADLAFIEDTLGMVVDGDAIVLVRDKVAVADGTGSIMVLKTVIPHTSHQDAAPEQKKEEPTTGPMTVEDLIEVMDDETKEQAEKDEAAIAVVETPESGATVTDDSGSASPARKLPIGLVGSGTMTFVSGTLMNAPQNAQQPEPSEEFRPCSSCHVNQSREFVNPCKVCGHWKKS